MDLNTARQEIWEYIKKGLDKPDLVVIVESWGLAADDLADAYKYLSEAFEKRLQNGEYYKFGMTDTGNAERFIRDFGNKLHYNYDYKKWLHWNGKCWEWDEGSIAMALTKETVRGIYREAAEEESDDKRKALYKHALDSESEPRRTKMLKLSQCEGGVPVKIGELDKNDWLFNCNNGTVDLRTGKIGLHNPKDLITMVNPIDYNPDAACELWMKFLQRISGGNKELMEYLQRGVGYSLTGDIREQCFFFLYGLGQNGKSTFVEAIRKVTGPYGDVADSEILIQRKSDNNNGHKESLANLIGKRFVSTSEVEEGQQMAVVQVKRITGGETVKASRKHEHEIKFQPVFKIWLSGNHKPEINDTTYSIWRRFKLIPFTVTIPDSEKDGKLPAKLESELPGILAWAVKGCLLWQKVGLTEPEVVKSATQTYRDDQDVLKEFLEDKCELYATARVSNKELSLAYEAWCNENNCKPINRNKFKSRMGEKGIKGDKGTNGVRIWLGVTLKGEKETAQGTMFSEDESKNKEEEPF